MHLPTLAVELEDGVQLEIIAREHNPAHPGVTHFIAFPKNKMDSVAKAIRSAWKAGDTIAAKPKP